MSYRDDVEALRAELAVLRRENAELRAEAERRSANDSAAVGMLENKVASLEKLLNNAVCNVCRRRIEVENERILCPDQRCDGVIGVDGICGTCGKHGLAPE